MVKLVLIIPDMEKEEDGILYDAAEFVRFSDSHCEKKNDFAVLCSIYVPDFGYLSKSFPVGATGIYLFDF